MTGADCFLSGQDYDYYLVFKTFQTTKEVINGNIAKVNAEYKAFANDKVKLLITLVKKIVFGK